MEIFAESLFFRIVWPGIWFGLWHYAPGSMSPGGQVWPLMLGSGMMGLYLGFLARKPAPSGGPLLPTPSAV